MAYFVASIIAVTSAMIIMLTRYEADDSSIKAELEHMKTMFVMMDGFVNTYIESGADLESLNFKKLDDDGILTENTVVSIGDTDKETTVSLPHNDVVWQIIPNVDEDADGNKLYENSSYKLLVDMTNDSTLMSKSRFSESFIGREYCENMLFGTFQNSMNSYSVANENFISSAGTNSDGKFVCVVFK